MGSISVLNSAVDYLIDETQLSGFEPRSERKRAELFEISADFCAFLTNFQQFSAHISALLCKVFALNILKSERISAHLLQNFRKFSRPGIRFLKDFYS